jgi:ring-1,2-phenylacetyl-CoA epoxidase subunit PaaC
MQRAVDALWRYTGELFVGWPPALAARWTERVTGTLRAATLTVPTTPNRATWSAGAGREGVHTEPFGRLLAEMQHLHRSHPGATW